jgi:thiamine biosynthesis protein ThiS
MTLQINGEAREFPDGLNVSGLVAQLGMKADRVAVELNLEIVPRANWESTALKSGDKLEIVHFVGGGSAGADAVSSPGAQSQAARWRCPSCGTEASTLFCAKCGEKKFSLEDLSFGHFVSHALGEFLHYDSKISRTFRLLFTKPGFLAAEYARGCRKPYLHPVQLFFIANIVYFILQPLTTWSGLRTTLFLHERNPFYGSFAKHLLAQRLAARGMTRAQFAPLFDHVVDLHAKSLVVLMVPIFAVVMLLLEVRKRRYFGEHMVFALHFCAFWLISVFIVLYGCAAAVILSLRHWGITVRYGEVDLLIYLFGAIFVCAYMAKAFRVFYRDGRFAAILKAAGLLASTLIVLQVYRVIQFLTALYSA